MRGSAYIGYGRACAQAAGVGLCILLLTALPIAATPAHAEPPPAPPASASSDLSAELVGDAKADYVRGRRLFDANDIEGALASFAAAHTRCGEPRLLWNMAVCARLLRRYGEGKRFAEQYVQAARTRGVLAAEDEATADAFLKSLAGKIVSVPFFVRPSNAVVIVDGQPLAATPRSDLRHVDVGTHTVEVHADGHRSQVFRQSFDGAAPKAIEVTLEPQGSDFKIVTASSSTIRLGTGIVAKGIWQGRVAPGHHVLEVTDAGGDVDRRELYLHDGEKRTLELWPRPRPSMWWWVAGAAAVGIAVGATGALVLDGRL